MDKSKLSLVIYALVVMVIYSCKNANTNCTNKVIVADSTYSIKWILEKDSGNVNVNYPHFSGICDTTHRNWFNFFYKQYFAYSYKPDTNAEAINYKAYYKIESSSENTIVVSSYIEKAYTDDLFNQKSFQKKTFTLDLNTGIVGGFNECFQKNGQLCSLLKEEFKKTFSETDTSAITSENIYSVPDTKSITFYINLEEINKKYSSEFKHPCVQSKPFTYTELEEFINPYGPLKYSINK